ncbi:MAG: hypothetical protein AABZ53_10100 [Planctomycetota bacterium]
MRTKMRSVLAVGLATLAGLALPVGSASAQVVRMNMRAERGGSGPTVSTASLAKYGELFGFDATQTEAAKTLHTAYRDHVNATQKEMQELMKKLESTFQDGEMQEGLKKMREASEKTAKVSGEATESFLKDIRSMLTPEQDAKWGKFEKMRRREGGLIGMGMVSGSNVDLIDLVGSLKLPATEATKIAGILDEYESAMDALLRENAAVMSKRADEDAKAQKEAGEGEMPSPEKMMESMNVMRGTMLKQRDLNKSFKSRISSSLGDEAKAKFDNEWLLRAFRRIYAEPQVVKQLKAAAKFDDITSEQRATIGEMLAAYEKDAAAINSKWAEAQEKSETEDGGGPMMFGPGQDQDSPTARVRKSRTALDKQTREKLRGILSEAQQEKLPKKPEGTGGVQIFGGGHDGLELSPEDLGIEVPDGAEVRMIVAPQGR